MLKKPPKTLYIISIKMVIVIMNDIICNHKYKKRHKINGWENIFSNEIITNANNPKKNPSLTNIKNSNHMI
jgi:hypothetical protein